MTTTEKRLAALAVACYALGYSLALIAHQPIGWAFVIAGGPVLIALGVLAVRRLMREADDRPEGTGSTAP